MWILIVKLDLVSWQLHFQVQIEYLTCLDMIEFIEYKLTNYVTMKDHEPSQIDVLADSVNESAHDLEDG